MRVLLSGYYGFGNLGDDALLDVIVRRLRERFPQLQLEVLSATPQATAKAYGIDSVSRWQWRSVREAIGRADVVLSGGGGLLQNATSLRSLFYYAAILRDAIRAKRKTMVFAQSIGPLDAIGRFVVRRSCRGLRRATVRDERSRALLAELLPQTPVERTSDPVFLYDAPGERVDLSGEGLGPKAARTPSSACVKPRACVTAAARWRAQSTASRPSTASAPRSCRWAEYPTPRSPRPSFGSVLPRPCFCPNPIFPKRRPSCAARA